MISSITDIDHLPVTAEMYERLLERGYARAYAKGHSRILSEFLAEEYVAEYLEGIMEMRLHHVRALTETLSISVDEAMNLLDIPEDERPMVINRLSL